MKPFLLSLLVFQVAKAARLYENKTTAVVELSSATFMTLVQNDTSNTQWVITYYAHWCGHCQHFAPEFIKIAETYRHETGLKFGAIDCADEAESSLANADICKQHNIRAYPTILLYQRGERKAELAKSVSDLLSDVKKLVDHVPLGLADSTVTDPVHEHLLVPPTGPAVVPAVDSHSTEPEAMIQDAALTMYRILRDEVFKGNSNILSPNELGDLVSLLRVCGDMLLPLPMREGCTNLSAQVTAVSQLTRHAWLALLDSELEHPKEYTTCKDFSCGMWRLLHLLTLSLDPIRAMQSTRFVVNKYFSCEVCRTHFISHYDACDFGRCSMPVDAVNVPAWLSRVHNGVNTRLGKPEWPQGHGDSNPLETYNKLRLAYGMSPITAAWFTSPAVWLIMMVLIAAAISVFTRSTLINRIKFSLTKKYHPVDIV